MTASNNILHEIAEQLNSAEINRQPIESLSARYFDLREEDAYSVQNMNAARGLKEGKRFVGYKVGLTSRAAQKHFQVFKPDFGHLFDSMSVLEESEIDLTRLIQPKIEGEIAFILGRELKGPGVTIVDVLQAVDHAVVAMEIIDSRIKDWKISAFDTIADNGSSALFVLSGRKVRIENLDFPSLGMAFSCNGEVVVTGAGGAVMGNPLSAVAFLANELGPYGKCLQPGEVILSGALSGMVSPLSGDSFTCEIQKLGKVSVRFGKGARS